MPLIFQKRILRTDLRAHPDWLFVFGDNLVRRGLGGQAKEMRGEPNAVGLPTKRQPDMLEGAFLRDADLEHVQLITQYSVARLKRQLNFGGTVVWPEDGIGTGLARLDQKAPRIAAFYDEVLELLKHTAVGGRELPPN